MRLNCKPYANQVHLVFQIFLIGGHPESNDCPISDARFRTPFKPINSIIKKSIDNSGLQETILRTGKKS
jgi:hypothetical protein